MSSCAKRLAQSVACMAASPAMSAARAKPITRSELARALAAVVSDRFDRGLVPCTKAEFGRILGKDLSYESAAVKTSKLLAGQLAFPEHAFCQVAERVGLTPAGLLREMATVLDDAEEK